MLKPDSSSRMDEMSDTPLPLLGPDLRAGYPADRLKDHGMVLGHVDGEPVVLVRRGAVTTRHLDLSIRGFGAPPSHASIELRTLSRRERIRRGLTAVGAGFAVAVLALPIPIVHFAVPPVSILAGLVFGVRRALQREIVSTAQGHCPFCGMDQTLGLNGSRLRLPRDLKCRSCLQLLTLESAG